LVVYATASSLRLSGKSAGMLTVTLVSKAAKSESFPFILETVTLLGHYFLKIQNFQRFHAGFSVVFSYFFPFSPKPVESRVMNPSVNTDRKCEKTPIKK